MFRVFLSPPLLDTVFPFCVDNVIIIIIIVIVVISYLLMGGIRFFVVICMAFLLGFTYLMTWHLLNSFSFFFASKRRVFLLTPLF